jgi:phospholipid/cholesterol/gamma-HCH transport system substrate-binding protein
MNLRSPRTRTRRRESASPTRTFVVAGVTTLVVVLLVALSLSIYHGVPWVNYKTIYATAPETGNLIPHDPVKIAGVRVGQVSGISIGSDGDARMKLQIDPSTKLPAGTSFLLRANGLLGSRYVELIPGHSSGELVSGSTLHGNADSVTYGVPEALDVFNAKTRGALGHMVTGLGTGLLGRGTGLNQTIHEIAAESTAAQQLVAGLVGPGHLSRLVPSLESLMSPLDTAKDNIAALLQPGATGFEPFVTQRAAVQNALAQAPSALAAANAGLGNGERLLDAADELSVQARAVLPAAPGGLKATTTLLATSHPALARTKSLLAAADPAIPAVLHVTGALHPVLPRLSSALARATPIANQVSPYGCNIENFATVIRSMTGSGSSAEPGGPDGPAMAFRLEIIPASPTELLGTADIGNLVQRVGYRPPCHYLSTAYPTFTDPLAGLDGQN